jgi:hypothetical protein
MSVNCIRCVIHPRTGPDLICDLCRNEQALNSPFPHDPDYDPALSPAASQEEPIEPAPVSGDTGIQKESQS